MLGGEKIGRQPGGIRLPQINYSSEGRGGGFSQSERINLNRILQRHGLTEGDKTKLEEISQKISSGAPVSSIRPEDISIRPVTLEDHLAAGYSVSEARIRAEEVDLARQKIEERRRLSHLLETDAPEGTDFSLKDAVNRKLEGKD